MRPLPAAVLLLLVSAAPGCLRSAAFTQGTPYPTGFERLEPSNIQLYRQGRSITLTNTTARSFGPSTIWLNQWFARDIEGLAVGQTLTLSLADFSDEYGDTFKGGGFFATTAPDRIVLAELETRDENNAAALIPLIVVGEREY